MEIRKPNLLKTDEIEKPNLLTGGTRARTASSSLTPMQREEQNRAAAALTGAPVLTLGKSTRRSSEKKTAPLTTAQTAPTLTERVSSAASGAAKTYAAGFANAGGMAAEGAGHLNTRAANYQSGDQTRQAAENIQRYQTMLRSGSWADGRTLTAADRQQLDTYIKSNQRVLDAQRGYTQAVETQDRNAAQRAYQAADRLAESGSADVERAKTGLGIVGRTAVDAGVAGGQMLADAGLGALTGGGALVPMAVRSFGGAAQEARQAGADYGQQLAYGAGSGALSVATERLSSIAKPFKQMFGGGVLDEAIAKAAGRLGQTAAGKLVLSTLSEGGEEIVEDLVQPILQRVTYDRDALGQYGNADYWAGALYDGLIGGILGGAGALPEAAAIRAGRLNSAGARNVAGAQTEESSANARTLEETIQNIQNSSLPEVEKARLMYRHTNMAMAERMEKSAVSGTSTAPAKVNYNAMEAQAIRKEAETFRNVVAGFDTKVSEFFNRWRGGRVSQRGEKLEKLYLGKMPDTVQKQVSSILGYEVGERDFIVTNDDVKHIFDHHGNDSAELQRGNIPLEQWMLDALPEVVTSPEAITPGNTGEGKKNAGKQAVIFSKTFPSGTVITVQFDNKGRGTMELNTLYANKKKGTSSKLDTATEAAPNSTPEALEPVPFADSVPENKRNVNGRTLEETIRSIQNSSLPEVEKARLISGHVAAALQGRGEGATMGAEAPSLKGMTEGERTALLQYKSSESYKINAKLRDGAVLTEAERKMVADLDTALEKLPVHEGTVYRRLSFDMEGREALDTFLAEHEADTAVRNAAYTSSSTAVDGYPVSGELTVTQIISSKTGRDMAGIGNNNESEILFARNTRFYVENVEVDADGKTVIYMEEVTNHGAGQLHSEEYGQTMQQVQAPQGENDNLQKVPGVDTRRGADGRGLPGVRGEGSEEVSSINKRLNAESLDAAERMEKNAASGTETAESIRVGQVTTIRQPYQGAVPVQTRRQNTAPVQVSSESLTMAQNRIAGVQGLEKLHPGMSFKSALKNAYKSVFEPAKGVVVEGASFDGKPYAVDIPNSVPGKVISDVNLTAEKLALLDSLSDVVRNGTYVGSGEYIPHGSKAKTTVRFDYFEAPVEINGKRYIVSFDVEAFPAVNNYRTHKLNEIELSPMANADTGRDPAANAMRTAPVEGMHPLNADSTIARGAENVNRRTLKETIRSIQNSSLPEAEKARLISGHVAAALQGRGEGATMGAEAPSLKGMTEGERTALLQYKSSESYKINAKLRDGAVLTEAERKMVADLDTALEKLPRVNGTVYRTLNFDAVSDPKGEFNAFALAHAEGNFARYKAYTSTSTKADGYPLTSGAKYGVTLEIISKDARSFAGIGNSFESKALFPRGTSFDIVKAATDENGHLHIYMKEIQSDVQGNQSEHDTKERGVAVRSLQEAHSAHNDLQGASARYPGGNSGREQNLQGAGEEVSSINKRLNAESLDAAEPGERMTPQDYARAAADARLRTTEPPPENQHPLEGNVNRRTLEETIRSIQNSSLPEVEKARLISGHVAAALQGRADGATMGETRSALREDGKNGQREAGRASKSNAGASAQAGERPGIPQGIREHQELGRDSRLWERHRRLTEQAKAYGTTLEFIAEGSWPKNQERNFAYASGGKIYVRENFAAERSAEIVPHECTHIMRQTGFHPYLDFLSRTADEVDFSTDAAKKLVGAAAAHRGINPLNLSERDLNILYDEVNALVSGAIASGKESSIEADLNAAFRNYKMYRQELTAIHEQFKRENGRRTNERLNAESLDAAEPGERMTPQDYARAAADARLRTTEPPPENQHPLEEYLLEETEEQHGEAEAGKQEIFKRRCLEEGYHFLERAGVGYGFRRAGDAAEGGNRGGAESNAEKAEQHGGAEAREAFLRRAISEGYTVVEGNTIAYGYRTVQRESTKESARLLQEEVKRLGIDAKIVDGAVLWNRNGVTAVQEVPQAVTADGERVFISNDADMSAREIAGHEAFHLWKKSTDRDAYIEALEDNLLFSSPDFLKYQSRIAEAYLGGEADITNHTQMERLREELFAYLSGHIHEGTHDVELRPMFQDYDAVKAAWNALVDANKNGARLMTEDFQKEGSQNDSGGNQRIRATAEKADSDAEGKRALQGTSVETVRGRTVSGQSRRIIQQAEEYGLHVDIVEDAEWPPAYHDIPAFSEGGKIYISETIPTELADMLVPHESTHIMRQTGYQPYLDFVEHTPEMLDMSNEAAQTLLKYVAKHQNSEVENANPTRLYDELNATLYGHIGSGNMGNLRPYLESAFHNFNAYVKELTAIHEQFKRENGRRTNERLNAESLDAAEPGERMTPESQRPPADLDSLRELWQESANALTTPDEIAAALVSSETKKVKKSLRETLEDVRSYFMRKAVDAGDSVSRIERLTGDRYLYDYYNMARASSSAGVNMITDEQTDITGKPVGKGLNEIFDPIRAKGRAYYDAFQMYLLHLHNIDRMSIESRAGEARIMAEEALRLFDEANPEISKLATEARLAEMAGSLDPYADLARERLKLIREINRLDKEKNKPVFGYEVTAGKSWEEAARLLEKHPEFAELQKEVRTYVRNLMQYRVDSGLMTQKDMEALERRYPNYVPTDRRWVQQEQAERSGGQRTDKSSVRIGKTIRQAPGGSSAIVPLHESLGRQTMKVVREGSKNRFGQRLLSARDKNAASAGRFIRNVHEYEASFSADTFDSLEEDAAQRITNTFCVFENGKLMELEIDPTLFEAVKALSPDREESNLLLRSVRAANDLFKKLVTGYNPAFTIRNTVRDFQTAGLYSRDISSWLANYPQAIREIKSNGAYWRQYKALGGSYSAVFDYQTGTVKESSGKVQKVLGVVEALNMSMEQAPRLAEFMSIVKKGDGSMENLMDAMHAAADVTVNFGRAGTLGKVLNATFVPFLNPGIQGFDRLIRRVTETRGGREWAKLVIRAAVLGVAPALINSLCYQDDEDWEDLRESDKDTNYLFKIGEGKWLKLPKGRELSILGMTGQRIADLVDGKEVNWKDFIVTVGNQVAPANPLTNNILTPLINDVDLFDPKSPGKTWYGGDIESQRLQNYAPGERYDASTDVFSQWLGQRLNLSPKKINYILDQYTGVVGDFVLPILTPRAEQNPLFKAFMIDSVSSNRISGDFYDMGDVITYTKNSGDAAMRVVSRFWNKQVDACGDIYAQIREIENSSLSNAEKKEQVRQAKAILNGIQKNALDVVSEYQRAVRQNLSGSSDDALDTAYREANRDCFGAEYALRVYSKDVYARAQAANRNGVSYPVFYRYYFDTRDFKSTAQKMEYLEKSSFSERVKAELYLADLASDSDILEQLDLEHSSGITAKQYWQYKLSVRGIQADRDADGKAIAGSKRAKVLDAINSLTLTAAQKDALYFANGYSEKTLGEAPWRDIMPKLTGTRAESA